MDTKDSQIDFLRWVLQNCSTSLWDSVVLENVQVKKLYESTQDIFYIDSNSDMKKLYDYYKKDMNTFPDKIIK